MRVNRISGLLAVSVALIAPASATETCATETPQPNVRRQLVNEAARLFAPTAVNRESLYFCAHQGRNAQAVIDAVPRRLPDGSDLVQQAACLRLDAGDHTKWDCHLFDRRQTEMMVTIGEAPTPFTVVLAQEASPELARRFVEKAVESSSRVSAENYCGSPPKYGLEAFRADFLGKTAKSKKAIFQLELQGAVWHVNRRLSGVSLVISEAGAPQFKCWTVWDEL